jgi:hypothetical protein
VVRNILCAKAVAANDILELNDLDLTLDDGDIIKVTTSLANELHFHIKLIERLGVLVGGNPQGAVSAAGVATTS